MRQTIHSQPAASPGAKNKAKGLAAGALLLFDGSFTAQAQQVLVKANVADDTVKTLFGPNRRYFGHAYVGAGLMAGPAGAGAGLAYGLRSAELRGGGRFKLRFTQALALNLDLGYAYRRYELAQNGRKTVPTPDLHRRAHQCRPARQQCGPLPGPAGQRRLGGGQQPRHRRRARSGHWLR
jgi:hypothetical protein